MITIEAAMAANPRVDFLPESQHRWAAEDVPLPIGHGQTNSQPTTVRNMLTLLELGDGDRVLDLGSGSGWTTAILSTLVGPEGDVTGVELIPELVARSRMALGQRGNARILEAHPGVLGDPGRAPFDRILVSAGARELPEELVHQLRIGGIMVIPVSGTMLKVRRTGAESFTRSHHGNYMFVPLITGD